MDDRTKRSGPEEMPAIGTSAAADLVCSGDLPCVWMLSGLLAYRLCDREYECEHCELDAALAGRRLAAADPPETETRGTNLQFPPDRDYYPAHGWVSTRADRRVRFGLDAFVAQLLDRVTVVVLPPINTRLQRGHPACWLVDDGEPIPLHAPVSGVVVAINTSVREDAGLAARDPYDRGWLLDLNRDSEPGRDRDLLSAADMRERSLRQLQEMRAIGAEARPVDPHLGVTLADGGSLTTDLRHALGTHKYHTLIRTLLR